ncbi:MAG: hypothetical protein JNM27_10820 [Leptospirales bacterium]|nr:hypothetical protein [Leptospirales bacterium]
MKKADNYFADLRQPDRIFRLDRDCILVFTGKTEVDSRPFLRIGAGSSLPAELLRHIENVVLCEQELANAALELQWMKATLGAGGESVRYVSSRERASQMYAYAGLNEIDEDKRPPVKMVPYGPFNSRVETKNKCIIMFMATGNFQVTLNSSKLLDYFSFRNQKMNIDKEYDMIAKAMHRRVRRAEKGVGFVYPGGTSVDRLSVYWFFDQNGLYVNPPENHHYDLLENGIEPGNLKMAIADSIHAPGFAEFVRRKSVLKETGGVYCNDYEHVALLKRIYNGMKWKLFDDGRPLPAADQAVFFKSKTGSHGIFSIRLNEASHDHVQVMFPIAPVKQSKSFDFTRGPFDLEFMKIDGKEDFMNAGSCRLTLYAPGRIALDVYGKQKLGETSYPIIPRAEYLFQNPEKPSGAADSVLHAIEGTPQHDYFSAIVASILAPRVKNDDGAAAAEITNALKAWEKLPAPTDLLERQNIHEAIRFLDWADRARMGFSPAQSKLIQSLLAKHRMSKFTNDDWLSIGSVKFHVVFVAGKVTLLLVQTAPTDPIRLRIPRTIEEISADPKAYASYLRQMTKILDKGDEPPGLRQCLEFAERLYEDRLLIVADRKRLQELKHHLGIHAEEPPKPVNFFERLMMKLGLMQPKAA